MDYGTVRQPTAEHILETALARVDAAIERASHKVRAKTEERQALIESRNQATAERDAARQELAALREKHQKLEQTAQFAAARIDSLIAIIESNFGDGDAVAVASVITPVAVPASAPIPAIAADVAQTGAWQSPQA